MQSADHPLSVLEALSGEPLCSSFQTAPVVPVFDNPLKAFKLRSGEMVEKDMNFTVIIAS